MFEYAYVCYCRASIPQPTKQPFPPVPPLFTPSLPFTSLSFLSTLFLRSRAPKIRLGSAGDATTPRRGLGPTPAEIEFGAL